LSLPCMYSKGLQIGKLLDCRTGLPSDCLQQRVGNLEDVLTQNVRHNDNEFDCISVVKHRGNKFLLTGSRYIGKESKTLAMRRYLGIEPEYYLKFENLQLMIRSLS
ncbi:MAG: hypothetical protein QW699_02675, partial [Metallosphaera sp.]